MDGLPPQHQVTFRASGCGVFWLLLLLFTVVPLTELALLLRVHAAIGLLPTLGLVLLTGTVGATLARWQGLRTLARIQEELGQGRIPGQALFDGALILVAGTLLVTPGVVTDGVGFALLLPPVRRGLGALLRRWATARVGSSAGSSGAGEDGVIDAEVVSSRPVHPEPPQPLALEGGGLAPDEDLASDRSAPDVEA